MQFGKNPGNLSRYSQQAKASYRGAQRPSGGKKGVIFRDKFVPTINGSTIRILPGDYSFELFDYNFQQVVHHEHEAHYCFVEHFDAMKKKGFICSGGPMFRDPEHREACHGCDLRDNDVRIEPGSRSSNDPLISARQMFSYNILDMARYHEIEQLDAQGNIVRNPNTQKPYTLWVPCEGRGCRYCQAGKKDKMGHSLHFPMGSRHFGELLEYTKDVTKICVNCGNKDAIETVCWICSNKQCGETFIDMSTTMMKDEEIEKISTAPVTCPHCGHTDLLEEIVKCRVCKNGRRASIFDVNLGIRKVKLTDDKFDTHIMIPHFSAPCPIDPTYASEAKPLDLASIYTPTPLDVQSRLLGLNDRGLAQGPQARDWSR